MIICLVSSFFALLRIEGRLYLLFKLFLSNWVLKKPLLIFVVRRY